MRRKFVTYTLSLCLLLMVAAPAQVFASQSCPDSGNWQNNSIKSTQYSKTSKVSYNSYNTTIKVIDTKGNDCATNKNGIVKYQLWQCSPSNTQTKPEVPVKPEIPTKPETPTQPETPVKPETPTQESGSTGNLNSYEQQVVDLVNKERAAAGLSPLKVNAKLSSMARAKAADLRDNNYFSHNSPVYGSPFDMMKTFGISYSSAAENIAKGQRTPESVMNGWMNSSGHRANILNTKFDQIGVGYVTDSKGNTYWVQEFIK